MIDRTDVRCHPQEPEAADVSPLKFPSAHARANGLPRPSIGWERAGVRALRAWMQLLDFPHPDPLPSVY
jgi:hypothetical protein